MGQVGRRRPPAGATTGLRARVGETGRVDPWGALSAFCFSESPTATGTWFIIRLPPIFPPRGDTHLGTDLSGGGPSQMEWEARLTPRQGELGALSPLATSPLISSGFRSRPVDKTQL